ncbi:hypothetical protein FS749_008958, partial [Ceratobasidium sp. UAMH 11750]
MSAFPPPPDSTGFGPRRSASAIASGSGSSGPRPAPQRSHSAHPRPGTSPQLLAHSPRTPTLQLSPVAPPARSLPLTPTSQSSQLLTPASGSPGRKPRAPSLRVDSASPISAQQMHMHASALEDSESVMGASVYRMVDELSLSGDESELFGSKEPISSARDPTVQTIRGPSGSGRAREAMVVRGGVNAGMAEMGMGNMTALASGIVTGLGGEAASRTRKHSTGQIGLGSGGGKVPPKRPSRSELRERASTNSLRTSNTIIPPLRQSSLYPAPRRATDGDSSRPTTATGGLGPSPSTSNRASPAGSSVASPGSTPSASATSTPNASSASVQYTSSSRPRTRDTTPTSPSPVKQPTRLPVPRATSPPPRVSEELL